MLPLYFEPDNNPGFKEFLEDFEHLVEIGFIKVTVRDENGVPVVFEMTEAGFNYTKQLEDDLWD